MALFRSRSSRKAERAARLTADPNARYTDPEYRRRAREYWDQRDARRRAGRASAVNMASRMGAMLDPPRTITEEMLRKRIDKLYQADIDVGRLPPPS